MTMEVVAQPLTHWPRDQAWFREFLKEELSPYPGRLAVVARMVLTATILLIIFMTFRIPGAPYAALYGLIITREDPQATLNAVKTNIIAFAYSAAFVLVGAMLFAGDPMLRLLWVVGALFTMFFGLSAMANYTAAARFGWMVVILIPIWDEHITAEAKVEGTLWIVGALVTASLLTALLELVFEALHPSKDLLHSLSERLLAVDELLTCTAEGRPVDQTTTNQLTRLSMLGMSRLRRILRRSADSLNYGEHLGAVVALVGRAVDIAAGLIQLSPQFSPDDRKRLRVLAGNLAMIRADLQAERVPGPVRQADTARSNSVPLLGELEKTVGLIPEVFAGLQSLSAYAPLPPGHAPPARLLVADAFTNAEHVKFALRGCLAASLCYVIYTSLAWPGISTAVTTCFLTALTTIGASHQKQVLRITGALAGGAAGLLAQIFILPSVDSITGFTLLFLVSTFPAAWLITAGPRLSYFGVQFAYAFYFINLSDFAIQTSLTIPRDRVVGILLGLAVMWLVFDQLWGAPAIFEMRSAFISTLRLLAQLAKEPLSTDLKVAIERSYSLRETINKCFDKVRALADGLVFEFGASRQQDLALRNRIVGWQPQLRALFVTRVALLKYRLQLPGFELPERIRLAQQEFDEKLAETLDGIADRLHGAARQTTQSLEDSFAQLEQITQTSEPGPTQGALASHLQTFLPLSRRIVGLAVSLEQQIGDSQRGR
jgi:multidrug resistance protein MdtO